MRRFPFPQAALAARSRFFLCALAAALYLASPLSPLRAALTATGDVSPANPATWTSSTWGYVGSSSTGAITVDSGSSLFAGTAYLGCDSGSSGTVTVTGAGSKFCYNFLGLHVGYSGSGTLNISNGGAVTGGSYVSAYIGTNSGSTGAATVDGSGSTWSGYSLIVGAGGTGTLSVTNGGAVSTNEGFIGYGDGSSGVVTIDGSGSTWKNLGYLDVGYSGSGTLNITGGGALTVYGATYVASSPGATGAVNFGSGGTLTTQSLYAAPNQLTGTGTITTKGLVSDIDLTFDSTASLTRTLTFNESGQNVAVNLTVGSGDLGAGAAGSGSLTIKNGVTVNSASGCLGYAAGSNGVATVQGTGSTWANSRDLTVGRYGNGTLNITGGGAVTVGGTTYLGNYPGSAGTINFGSGGGTLTTGSLVASSNQLTGTGTINARGLVSDLDLVFDSTASLARTINFNQPGQNIALNLNMGSNPSSNGSLGAGATGSGSLTIRNGVAVTSALSYLGYSLGSSGVATVDGTASTWTSSELMVGNYGMGTLNVTGGGTVISKDAFEIGEMPGSIGVVNVDGKGSTLGTTKSSLCVGVDGSGTLNITRGATVKSELVVIGGAAGASGVANVDGSGSTWTNPSVLYVGDAGRGALNITGGAAVSSSSGHIGDSTAGGSGVVTVDGAGSNLTIADSWLFVGATGSSGALNLSGGGKVTTQWLPVASGSVVGIDVASGSALTLTGNATITNGGTIMTTGTLTNNGTVRILAGAGVTAGQHYSPITASSWNGSGVYQALGGTWDNTNHVFTVSNVLPGPAGSPLSIDLDKEQRVLVNATDQSHWSVGASFLASNQTLSLTATTISGSTRSSLESLLNPQQSILGGWEFSFASGYTEGDPAYLSIGIGSGYSRNGLEVWHFDGSTWTPFSADDLTYDGTYASFTVTGFSGYAITTVPEPSMLALLVSAGLGLLSYARRRRVARFIHEGHEGHEAGNG